MSIVKDIERIGDYAKQLLRVAHVRGPFTTGSATHAELTAYCERISGYLTEVRDALCAYDSDGARALMAGIHGLTDEVGAAIAGLLVADPAPADGAARALAYHYLARICSHLSNILTSLVMPSTSSTSMTSSTRTRLMMLRGSHQAGTAGARQRGGLLRACG